MPHFHEFLLFVAAGLLLNITPGADMLYVITSSARYGVKRGAAAALGIFAGTLVHITLTVVGLSAMLAASALAFSIVKYVGAAYLVYLGATLILARPTAATADADVITQPTTRSSGEVFRRGALINILNPKIALFFLAFLPQFIDPAAGDQTLAFGVLGLTFNVTGTTVNLLAAVSAASIGRLPVAKQIGGWAQRAVGVLFIGLGARLCLSGD